MTTTSFGLQPNSLYYGDCLEIMGGWPAQQIDLIYLDPPFNSKADYDHLFGAESGAPAQVRAFTDTWTWNEAAAERYERLTRAVAHPAHKAILGFHGLLGPSGMLSYLTYMSERLDECRRMLKPTGSIYLHCDPTASHYLKIIMDGIFGAAQFRNEIIWGYTGPGSPGMRQFNRKHDTIFWYSNGDTWCFNPDAARISHNRKQTKNFKPGLGGSGVVRGNDGLAKGSNVPETWWVQRKGNGLAIASRQAKQYLGYPTQKPIALLQRIIAASSNPGDLVLDPFCGCGTTIDAANRLGRNWIGIDISPLAARLVREQRLKDTSIQIFGIPTDMEGARALLRSRRFDFEAWIVTSINGLAPNEVQTGDGGIDGRGRMLTVPRDQRGFVLAQVKRGGYTTAALRDFEGTMARENATAGIFITLERVTTARVRAAAAGKGTYTVGATDYPRLQFWSVEEYLDGIRPNLPSMADPYTGKAVQTDIFMGR